MIGQVRMPSNTAAWYPCELCETRGWTGALYSASGSKRDPGQEPRGRHQSGGLGDTAHGRRGVRLDQAADRPGLRCRRRGRRDRRTGLALQGGRPGARPGPGDEQGAVRRGRRARSRTIPFFVESHGRADPGRYVLRKRAPFLPLAVSTAACGLFQKDHLALQHTHQFRRRTTGKTLLVWGGSTSVGSNAIQLAVAAGYEVFATASPRNLRLLSGGSARARSFDYNEQDGRARHCRGAERQDHAPAPSPSARGRTRRASTSSTRPRATSSSPPPAVPSRLTICRNVAA